MKILLFETDETIRKLYQEILVGFGWRVVLARSLDELEKVLNSRGMGRFDNAILDLPYNDATAILNFLELFGAKTQITLISGGVRPETWKVVKELKGNVRLVVPKPHTLEEVLGLGDPKKPPK